VRSAVLPMVLASLLLSLACTPGDITSSLDRVVGAVELALPLLTLAGVPGQVIILAQGYLQSVSVAVNETTAELASADNSAVKAAKIGQYFAAAIVPNLPAGTPPIVGQLLKAVSDAVAALLGQLAGSPGVLPGSGVEIKMRTADRVAIEKIKARNATNLAKLAVH